MNASLNQERDDEVTLPRIVGERRPSDLPYWLEDEAEERWHGWRLVAAWLAVLALSATCWWGVGVAGYRLGLAVAAAVWGQP
jgi:hypothetical protein